MGIKLYAPENFFSNIYAETKFFFKNKSWRIQTQ